MFVLLKTLFLYYVYSLVTLYSFHNLIGSYNYRLFETHPDIQDVFTPFRGMTKEEMKHSSSLRAHALRVMSAVEKLLARINDMDKVEQLLYEMGQRHMMYDAKVDYIDVSICHEKVYFFFYIHVGLLLNFIIFHVHFSFYTLTLTHLIVSRKTVYLYHCISILPSVYHSLFIPLYFLYYSW